MTIFKFQNFLIPVLMASFLAISCSKDDDDQDNQNSNQLTVTIDGSVWQNTISNTATSGGTTQVNAFKNSDNSSVQIFFPEDTTGTFNFATSSIITVAYTKDNVLWNNNLSGSITITTNNQNSISGTFNTMVASAFSNTDTLNMTNGSFNWQF